LAQAKLNPSQLSALAGLVSKLGPLELNKLVPAFTNSVDVATGNKLIDGLISAKAITGLRNDVLKVLAASLPPAIQPRAQEVFELLNVDVEKQKRHIDQLLGELGQGDVRRGQMVFNNPKFACSACHAIGFLGGRLGPDLTTISKIRTERDLLESIVYPSASFVRSYEPYTVTTKSGTIIGGLLQKDAPDEIVLVAGPDGETRLPRQEVAEMAPGTISIMPQGLDGLMTKEELADLLAFLKTTTW
jgi:putative heme-binding domain-containing protein